MTKPRSTRATLLAATLGMEAAVVLFIAIAASALGAAHPLVALGGGIVLIAAFVLAARMQRTTRGIAIGAVLQAALLALGILLPASLFVSVLFVAMWVWSLLRGAQVDRARAAYEAAHPAEASGAVVPEADSAAGSAARSASTEEPSTAAPASAGRPASTTPSEGAQ